MSLAYACIAFLVISLLRAYGLDPSEVSCSTCHSSPLAAELCQYLELAETGVEGEVSRSDLTLRSVSVVFRHGERFSLTADDDFTDCSPYRDADREHFETYRKLLDSSAFRKFLSVDKHFAEYPLYPERSSCSGGNLTAEGALQHSRLGNHLRGRYEKTGLFRGDKGLNVSVVASPFRRTFQSAVALSSSFIFPLNVISKLNLDFSSHTYLCTTEDCDCPKAIQYRAQYEKEHLNYFLTRSPKELREKAQRIFGEVKATKKSKDPFAMMDVMLGRYICRRQPLPCTANGECVTMELIQELLNETTRRGEKMFVEGRGKSVSPRLITAESMGILSYVAKMKETLEKNEGFNYVNLYSGHDVTVSPLLRSLRLHHVDFPRYASHIVFEIYEDKQHNFYLRLVYNGKDRTKELPFCQFLDFCPMEEFIHFYHQLLPSQGFQNVKELCEL